MVNQDILAEVRRELNGSPAVTYENFRGLVYMNAVFNEVHKA